MRRNAVGPPAAAPLNCGTMSLTTGEPPANMIVQAARRNQAVLGLTTREVPGGDAVISINGHAARLDRGGPFRNLALDELPEI